MTATFDKGKEGQQLAQEGFYQTAEAMLATAFPNPVNLFNRANCLRRMMRYQEAYDLCVRALAIDGTNRDEINNLLGCCALDLGRAEEAKAIIGQIAHKHHWYGFSYALACLYAGDWQMGFHYYESRLHEHVQPLPMWEGEPLPEGQILAVQTEQGLGDSIMMSRFRELLPCKHILLTSNPLTRILDGHSGNRPFAAWKMVPMMSLPHRLGIKELPKFKPYIFAKEKFDVPRLADTVLNVGLIWKSKAGGFLRKRHEIEHGEQKSIPLASLLPLAAVPGVKLFSLQYEGDSDIGALGAGLLMDNLGVRIMDMSDLSSFLAEMDVLVTCDSGPAHLAGAMGVHTLVIVNLQGSWQYGSGDRTPWYGSNFEIYRQQQAGNWQAPISQVAKRLSILCDMSRAGTFTSAPPSILKRASGFGGT